MHKLKKEYLSLVQDTLAYLGWDKKPEPKIQLKPPKSKPKPPTPPLPTPSPPKKTIAPKKKQTPIEEKDFVLETPKASLQNSFSELLNKSSLNLHLRPSPPSDEEAKRIKNAWKLHSTIPEVPILFSQDLMPYKTFLANIALAIEKTFFSSHLVSTHQIDNWETFFESPKMRCILIADSTLFKSSQLMNHYREIPQAGKRYLGPVPALLLPDLSLYFKDPLLKRSLWNVICQTMQSLQ